MSELDAVIRESLIEFAGFVAQTGWWGREREAVSLFAFGHLVPRCRGTSPLKHPTQIGIDVAVQQVLAAQEVGVQGPGDLARRRRHLLG